MRTPHIVFESDRSIAKLRALVSFLTVVTLVGINAIRPAVRVLAQSSKAPIKTDTKITYHNGSVMKDATNVYMIWYGNWAGSIAPNILTDLVLNLGSTPYFNINTLYPDSAGNAPNGGLIYSGAASDPYSHDATLTPSDIQGVVRDLITSGSLPLDPNGVYVIFASADVTDIYPDGTTFCAKPFPHHGSFSLTGTTVKYGFLGNADRCPSTAPWFFGPNGNRLNTPNGNFGADVMASQYAHLMSVSVTDPTGSGWYDRYGFENAAKCYGIFGPTYQTPGGGPANIRIGQRDFMIQQNWVNARKGYCSLSAPSQ